MKILVIKLGAIGDVLRTTSILKGLKEKYKAKIDWLTRENSYEILMNNRLIDNVFVIEDFKLKEKYDLVINLDEELEACRTATEAGKKIVGCYLENNEIKYTDDSREWFDMGLASRLGKEKADELKKRNKKTYQGIISGILGIKQAEIMLSLDKAELEFAGEFAEKNNIKKKDLVIGLNTGAGKRWQFKRLGEEKTAELADRLAKELNAKVILFGGKDEKVRNMKIKSLAKEKIIDAGCDNSLLEFAALLNLCNVVVSSDSLALNIALALKKKVVVFFGPTSPTEIEMYGLGKKIVPDLGCVCCYKRECDIKPNCMMAIKVEDIFNAVKELKCPERPNVSGTLKTPRGSFQ